QCRIDFFRLAWGNEANINTNANRTTAALFNPLTKPCREQIDNLARLWMLVAVIPAYGFDLAARVDHCSKWIKGSGASQHLLCEREQRVDELMAMCLL